MGTFKNYPVIGVADIGAAGQAVRCAVPASRCHALRL